MSDTHIDLDRLIDRISDDSITRQEFLELEASLLADPELRQRFRSRMRLEANLHSECQVTATDILPPMMQGSPRSRVLKWPVVALAGMAAVLAVALFFSLLPAATDSPEFVATIETQNGAAWSAGAMMGKGTRLTSGTIQLERGMVNLRFESGAIAALEAPVTLELIDPMRCRLTRGKAVFEVPDSAIGFVVETPNGYAVDHGTRFAVGLRPDGEHVEFGVLDGKISVYHEKTASSQEVITGGMVTMTPAGIGKADPQAGAPTVPSADSKLLRFRSNGLEASIVRGDMREDFLEPGMLMVKKDIQHWDEKDLNHLLWAKDRRSLIGFNLDDKGGWLAQQARLRLNLVYSDRGYANLLPEKTSIEVYGIRDDPALESWDPAGLKWADAPGSQGDGFDVDPSEVTLLGSFDIDRSYLEGPVVFESGELTRFVNEDRSGVVGFLLVSTSQPLDAWSLVHAFASSDHVEAAGPLLEITVEQAESIKER